MFAEVLAFLAEDGWPVRPETYDELPCIGTRFIGTEQEWDCRARPYDPFGQLAFESVLPCTVAAAVRPAVAELTVRANWRLLTGAFQLDLDGGELLFRTMLFVPNDGELTGELLRGLVYGNVLTVERCLPQFLDAVAGGDPAEAYRALAL